MNLNAPRRSARAIAAVPAKRSTRSSPSIPVETASRDDSLRLLLKSRRLELTTDVQGRMRERRVDGVAVSGDIIDDSDAAVEAGLQLALLEMRARNLAKLDDAIARLDVDRAGHRFVVVKDQGATATVTVEVMQRWVK